MTSEPKGVLGPAFYEITGLLPADAQGEMQYLVRPSEGMVERQVGESELNLAVADDGFFGRAPSKTADAPGSAEEEITAMHRLLHKAMQALINAKDVSTAKTILRELDVRMFAFANRSDDNSAEPNRQVLRQE